MGVVAYYELDPAGGEGPGRREGRRPIHARAGRAARRNAPPHPRSTARATSHPPRRLAGRPERERPNKSEHSQSERADVHGSGVLSRMCNAARLAVPTHPTLPRRARASRAPPAASCATRNARHDPRATPARARPRVRSCVRACACAMRRARWRGAPSLPTLMARPRVTRAWRAAREEARDTAAHTPPPRVRARGPAAAA